MHEGRVIRINESRGFGFIAVMNEVAPNYRTTGLDRQVCFGS
jgi:hypothetical protein